MKIIGQTNSLPVIEEASVSRIYRDEPQEDQKMDPVIVEHLLAIIVNGQPCAILTCSPENLIQLVVGHLYAQGRIVGIDWIACIELSEDCKVASVTLTSGKSLLPTPALTEWGDVEPIKPKTYDKEQIFAQATSLYESADWFLKTGAAHSSSLSFEGDIKYRFADVSRHNTIDKLVGQALIDDADLTQAVLFTSGRIPVDMLTKVARCGIPIVCSRSAPTTAALSLAKQLGITLIGFVREGRMNVYNV